MPSSLFLKEESETIDPDPNVSFPSSKDEEDSAFSSGVGISSLNRDGIRSAFTPYRPTTVLTNLQRGNVQTQTPCVLPERGIHQLAAQGELFLQIEVDDPSFEPDKRDEDGLTPLMWASCYGQLETVRKLIACGASISAVGNTGENALILASASGHPSIVKELIAHGVSLDYRDQDGNSAMMYAAYNNHAICVQELLYAGADLTLTNEGLESAFDLAIKKRSKHAQAIMEKHMLNLLQADMKS